MYMEPTQLGEQLARLVWESVSDFIDAPMSGGGAGTATAVPLVHEEVLILFLWVHTRACQQAFAGRADPAAVRAVLDSLHRAVYEDLEAHGIPRETLPLFEQRLSARYSAYYAAASREPTTVGDVAASYVTGAEHVPPALTAALAESSLAVAGPLRDFLEDVVLTPG